MKKFLRSSVWFACFALTASVALARVGPSVPLDVAVNSKVPLQQLSIKSLRALFLLKAQFWPDSEPVVIVLQPEDSELHNAFCAAVLDAPCDVIDEAESEKRFQGALFARVMRANSAADAAQLLQRYPTAIGYFRRGSVPAGARTLLQP